MPYVKKLRGKVTGKKKSLGGHLGRWVTWPMFKCLSIHQEVLWKWRKILAITVMDIFSLFSLCVCWLSPYRMLSDHFRFDRSSDALYMSVYVYMRAPNAYRTECVVSLSWVTSQPPGIALTLICSLCQTLCLFLQAADFSSSQIRRSWCDV